MNPGPVRKVSDWLMRKDKGHYSEKHPGVKIENETAERLKKKRVDGAMTCPLAFQAAIELNQSPGQIGQALDILEIPISKCQLGLFGYTPVRRIVQAAETVADDLEAAIRRALVEERLPCDAAFRIASDFKMAKIRVSGACEKLKIRISRCQLGAF